MRVPFLRARAPSRLAGVFAACIAAASSSTRSAQADAVARRVAGREGEPAEQGALFVARIATLRVPESAYGPEGASDVAFSSDSASLDASVYSASGVLLAEPARGGLRTHLRFTREGASRSYVVLRASRPTEVRFVFSATPSGAPAPETDEPAAPRAELLAVGGATSASAPRRVAARADDLALAGFRASPVAALAHPAPIRVPESVRGCAFVTAAVDAGAVTIAGVALAEGADATLWTCDAQASLEVVATDGRPRVAYAWLVPQVASMGPDSSTRELDPAAVVLLHELGTRGFDRIASYDVAAVDGGSAVALEVELAEDACVAIAALGRGGSLVDVRLTGERGELLARSESRAPASRVYYCADRHETLTAWVRTDPTSALPARVFVAHEAP